MNATLKQPTEPTTDSLSAVLFARHTSNRGYARLSEFGQSTPSGELKIVISQYPTDRRLYWLVNLAAADQAPPRTRHTWIDDLGEAGYRLLQRIPVEIRRVDIGDYEASFREANIAISGSDHHDAYQALVAEILDTYDVLRAERKLGSDAAEQLRILHTHIVRS